MLDDAFRQAIDINRESSFVEAATGRPNDQVNTRIDTQINELEDSFQDYEINAMSTRANSRSGNRSLKGYFVGVCVRLLRQMYLSMYWESFTHLQLMRGWNR